MVFTTHAKLEGIEEQVSSIKVPLAFSEELYYLRMHIDMISSKLKMVIENSKKVNNIS